MCPLHSVWRGLRRAAAAARLASALPPARGSRAAGRARPGVRRGCGGRGLCGPRGSPSWARAAAQAALGNVPQAEALCAALLAAGVASAVAPGRRLRSQAWAPECQARGGPPL